MTTTQRKPKMAKNRISPPFISNEALISMSNFEAEIGNSIPSLLAQVAEATKKGKPENWHRAVAAFQDAIER